MNIPLNDLEVIVYSSDLIKELDLFKQAISRTIRGERRSGGRLIIFEKRILKQVADGLTSLTPHPFSLTPNYKEIKEKFKRKFQDKTNQAWRREIFWQTVDAESKISRKTKGQFFQMMEKYFILQTEAQSRKLLLVLLSEQTLVKLQQKFLQDKNIRRMPKPFRERLSLLWEEFSCIYEQSFSAFVITENLKGKGGDFRHLWETWTAKCQVPVLSNQKR